MPGTELSLAIDLVELETRQHLFSPPEHPFQGAHKSIYPHQLRKALQPALISPFFADHLFEEALLNSCRGFKHTGKLNRWIESTYGINLLNKQVGIFDPNLAALLEEDYFIINRRVIILRDHYQITGLVPCWPWEQLLIQRNPDFEDRLVDLSKSCLDSITLEKLRAS